MQRTELFCKSTPYLVLILIFFNYKVLLHYTLAVKVTKHVRYYCFHFIIAAVSVRLCGH